MVEELLEAAEEPGLWLPPEPKLSIVPADGFSIVFYGRDAWIQHIRLGEEPRAVERAVEQVAAVAGEREVKQALWWIGELTTPRDLHERLAGLGFEPDEPPEMTSLTLAAPPAGEPEPAVEVRRVESYEELQVALELDWSVFGVPESERELRRAETRSAWAGLEASGRVSCYVGFLDGDPAGFGRVVFTPRGGLLLGGATLPQARGQGVYTSLVHARWNAAVERGTPRLIVSAGPESGPILVRLGFEPIGTVKLLRQRVA